MQLDQKRTRLDYRGSFGSRAWSAAVKALSIGVAGLMLVGAIAVSILMFAVALTGVLAFGVYFWWKTREARKQLRTRFERGDVIDGVVVREVEVRQIEDR